LKELQKICVVGLGFLGGSISQTIRQRLGRVKVVGYSHRAATRARAGDLGVADVIADELADGVADADLIILATPIFTFEKYFADLSKKARDGAIVTDVGSTKVAPHAWADGQLDGRLHYVGSHPVAGSEQRGVEYSRDDLLDRARCIVTATSATNRRGLATVKRFWAALGCVVQVMSPIEHDRIFANISHLPHVLAASLVNASDREQMKLAGKGFLDSTRIASGPATVWTDVVMANSRNIADGIDRFIAELSRLQTAIYDENRQEIQAILADARRKRAALVKYKIRKKELLS
jgi:prephenate dehydrogenase